MNFKELSQKILSRACPHPVRLIGVDGGAGAGKSTFAGYLAEALGAVPVIPMDDFLAWDDLTEFWPRMEAQVLEPLFSGKGLRYQMRDWAGDNAGRGLKDWRELPFSSTVVLEGIGALRRKLQSRLCYGIWIDTPETLRFQRGIERDKNVEGAQSLWETWTPGEKAFIELERAFERADLVVDGTVPYEGEAKNFKVIRERA